MAWAGLERLHLGLADPPPVPRAPPAQPPSDPAANCAAAMPTAAAAPGAESAASGTGAVSNPEASAPAVMAGAYAATAEWVEVRPRWPLTYDKHPNCALAAVANPRKRRRRVLQQPQPRKQPFEALTDATRRQLHALRVSAPADTLDSNGDLGTAGAGAAAHPAATAAPARGDAAASATPLARAPVAAPMEPQREGARA